MNFQRLILFHDLIFYLAADSRTSGWTTTPSIRPSVSCSSAPMAPRKTSRTSRRSTFSFPGSSDQFAPPAKVARAELRPNVDAEARDSLAAGAAAAVRPARFADAAGEAGAAAASAAVADAGIKIELHIDHMDGIICFKPKIMFTVISGPARLDARAGREIRSRA